MSGENEMSVKDLEARGFRPVDQELIFNALTDSKAEALSALMKENDDFGNGHRFFIAPDSQTAALVPEAGTWSPSVYLEFALDKMVLVPTS